MLEAPACPECDGLLVRHGTGEYRCLACPEVRIARRHTSLERVGEIALAVLAPAMIVLVVVLILVGACTVKHVHRFEGAVVCKTSILGGLRCEAEKPDAGTKP